MKRDASFANCRGLSYNDFISHYSCFSDAVELHI
jgi:hypothetical protein